MLVVRHKKKNGTEPLFNRESARHAFDTKTNLGVLNTNALKNLINLFVILNESFR